MPIRLQVCAICGRSHVNVYNVRVQSVMMYYITMSHAYATPDSVRNQENMQNSPDPFPSQRVGSGDLNSMANSDHLHGQANLICFFLISDRLYIKHLLLFTYL